MKSRIIRFSMITLVILLFYSLIYLASMIMLKQNLKSYDGLIIFVLFATFVAYILIPSLSIALGVVCSIKRYGYFFSILLAFVNVGTCGLLFSPTLNINTDEFWHRGSIYLISMFCLSIVAYCIMDFIGRHLKSRQIPH